VPLLIAANDAMEENGLESLPQPSARVVQVAVLLLMNQIILLTVRLTFPVELPTELVNVYVNESVPSKPGGGS